MNPSASSNDQIQLPAARLSPDFESSDFDRHLQFGVFKNLIEREHLCPTAAVSQGATNAEIETMRFDMNELRHRIKNMVSVIQSISRQTMRQYKGGEEFDSHFSARLSAYCRSVDRLIANDWEGIDLHDLVKLQLESFGGYDDGQVSVTGPSLKLRPDAAHAIGLALHELATNAVKYGALSVPAGKVGLSWTVSMAYGAEQLSMAWRESGGPSVLVTGRRGFGSEVIEKMPALSLQATVAYRMAPQGVSWEIVFDAANGVVQTCPHGSSSHL